MGKSRFDAIHFRIINPSTIKQILFVFAFNFDLEKNWSCKTSKQCARKPALIASRVFEKDRKYMVIINNEYEKSFLFKLLFSETVASCFFLP
jgi:hypothetical protein